MKNSKTIVSMLALLVFSITGSSAQAQRQTSRATDRQVGVILQRLERNSNRFRNSLNVALVRARIDQTRPQNDINSFAPAFESATNQFRDQFTRRRAGAADIRNILQTASPINGFMSRNRLNRQVQNDWALVRTDLNALANIYNVSWQWNQETFPPVNSNPSSRLSESELNQLIRRLETGQETFRSSLTDAFDRNRYDQTTGERNMNDAVQGLKNDTDQLRHQFDTRQPVAAYVERVLARVTPIDTYMRNNRLTDQAQSDWLTLRGDLNTLAGAYSLAANWGTSPSPQTVYTGTTGGEFIVRDGETLMAVLNTDLTTQQTKQGDRFTMTVRGPDQYEGAVIEGTVGSVDPGGRLTGRSGISLNFDTIRLRNGQAYKFAGVLGSVRTTNGETVNVDNEGSAQGSNQTTQTIQRAGIGTAIGAIIGAIAGGGKGAVIGGVIGAAGGAGSVYVQGKDDFELPSGTEVTIRASAPR